MHKVKDLTEGDTMAEGFLGMAYGRAGKKAQAERILDALFKRAEHEHVDPLAFALVYLGLDEKDQALAWLEQAYEERTSWLIFLNTHSAYDPLRAAPRFTELLQKVGLPLDER